MKKVRENIKTNFVYIEWKFTVKQRSVSLSSFTEKALLMSVSQKTL